MKFYRTVEILQSLFYCKIKYIVYVMYAFTKYIIEEKLKNWKISCQSLSFTGSISTVYRILNIYYTHEVNIFILRHAIGGNELTFVPFVIILYLWRDIMGSMGSTNLIINHYDQRDLESLIPCTYLCTWCTFFQRFSSILTHKIHLSSEQIICHLETFV